MLTASERDELLELVAQVSAPSVSRDPVGQAWARKRVEDGRARLDEWLARHTQNA